MEELLFSHKQKKILPNKFIRLITIPIEAVSVSDEST